MQRKRIQAIIEATSRNSSAQNRTDKEFKEIMDSLQGRELQKCEICKIKYYVGKEEDFFIGDEPGYRNSIIFVEKTVRPSFSRLPNPTVEWLCSLCVQIDYEDNYDDDDGYVRYGN